MVILNYADFDCKGVFFFLLFFFITRSAISRKFSPLFTAANKKVGFDLPAENFAGFVKDTQTGWCFTSQGLLSQSH